jgi:PAS domain S-box-containing protein
MSNSPSSAKSSVTPIEAKRDPIENRQTAFLLRAGQVMGASLDYEKTLASIVDLMVPRLGDWCSIHMPQEDGTIPTVAMAHSDPAKMKLGWQMHRRYVPAGGESSELVQVMQRGEPLLVSHVSEEFLSRVAKDGEHLALLQCLGMSSLMFLPMNAGNRVLGVISLAASGAGVKFDRRDVDLAMQVARIAARALDNARLYQEAQNTVQEKEETIALLTAVLQQLPSGVAVANAAGEVSMRNQAAMEFWKTTESHPEGASGSGAFFSAFHPDGTPFRREEWPLIRALRNEEEIVAEEVQLRKVTGERCTLRINAAPVRDRYGRTIAAAAAFEDVTDKLESQRALRESEGKFRTLAEVAPCSIFIHDGEKLLYANRATSEITGYSNEELLGRSFWSMLQPQSVPYIRERMKLRSEGKQVPEQFEAGIFAKDGTARWIEFNGKLFDYDGRQAVICVALDVTARQRSNQELQKSQERIRLAAESAGIATWEWDIRKNVVSWSPELRRTFGFEDAQELGTTFDALLARVHGDDRDRVRRSIESAASEHQDLSVEFRILRGDERWGWAFAKAKIFYDTEGMPESIVGVTVDVTGAKAAEQAVQESEERFRITFNQAAVGMAHCGLDGTLLMANQKLSDILGYPVEDIFGKRFHSFTHGEDLPASVEKLESMLAGKCNSYRVENRYVRKDGSLIWGQVTSALVRDERGAPKYIIAVIEDITERRRAEEALRNSEKLAATGRLAASIAHEINNPLEAVTNLLYLLERNKSLDETAKGYARMAQEEITRVAHIARQTLGFYRDSADFEMVPISEVVNDVLGLYDRKIRNAEVAVVRELAEVTVEGMPGQLRQMLSNLVANALDAIGSKGKLHVRVRRTRSWTGRGTRGVRISVGDNGGGISRENRKSVFEPFFTTKGAKGTGLGLWVTRGMIEKHAGKIGVWSSAIPGRSGTVFSIFLPLRQKRGAGKQTK